MHLVPPERADHRIIDGDLVCDAIAAIGEPGDVRTAAGRFSLLAEPGRLALLFALRGVGPMAVSDLAVATGMKDPAVSQALRLLRSAGAVAGERDGRIIRYRIVDADLAVLLDQVRPAQPAPGHHGHGQGHAHRPGREHENEHGAGHGLGHTHGQVPQDARPAPVSRTNTTATAN